MVARLRANRWVFSAVLVGAGIPLLLFCSLYLVIALMWGFETHPIGPIGPGPWIWASVFGVATVVGGLLAVWAVARDGWRALVGAVALLAACSAGLYMLSDVQTRMQPDNPMAGLGAGIGTWVVGAVAVLVLTAGVVTLVVKRALQGPAATDVEAAELPQHA
jgi:hypothetical protein